MEEKPWKKKLKANLLDARQAPGTLILKGERSCITYYLRTPKVSSLFFFFEMVNSNYNRNDLLTITEKSSVIHTILSYSISQLVAFQKGMLKQITIIIKRSGFPQSNQLLAKDLSDRCNLWNLKKNSTCFRGKAEKGF